MRTILSLAVGFWLGREIYRSYDKEEAERRENEIKEKLLKLLKEKGIEEKEAEVQATKLLSSELSEP